ncbi:MAG: hypothetical protein GY697_28120 [Desulfobacterales bacterium]|nr:hypothetical protein [Desulfobacterales bacterium]
MKMQLFLFLHRVRFPRKPRRSQKKSLAIAKIILFVFSGFLALSFMGGCGETNEGHVILRSGWPSGVSLVGYDKKTATPLYQVILPGVYQTRNEIIIKKVQPGQEEAVLPIAVNEDGVLSYDQCIELLAHLKEAYGLDIAFYQDDTIKKLQSGEQINVPEFYAMLKKGMVPPLSAKKVAEMNAAIDADKRKERTPK